MIPVLEAKGLSAGYGQIRVVSGVDIKVERGQIAALMGPNGAGKTTSLRALVGAIPQRGGEVHWQGTPTRAPLHRRASDGLAYISEERAVVPSLTVRDNLRIGRGDLGGALEQFPELAPLLRRRASLLSGGEQQMLAVATAMSRRPTALVVDELSLGLAPLIVERLLKALRQAADEGLAVLLVEQHVAPVLRVADVVYVMSQGVIVYEDTAEEARSNIAEIEATYLGNASP